MLKQNIRTIGFDDGPFERHTQKEALLIGIVMRGNSTLEGVLSGRITLDGDDATEVIARMIVACKFRPQLRCIFLNGIAVGGLNIIDIQKLHGMTEIPVIATIRKNPDIQKIKKIILTLNQERKVALLENAGPIIRIGKLYIQCAGIDAQKAADMLRIACRQSILPESVRMAHIIASGIVRGESYGRA